MYEIHHVRDKTCHSPVFASGPRLARGSLVAIPGLILEQLFDLFFQRNCERDPYRVLFTCQMVVRRVEH